MVYSEIRTVHLISVVISIALFALRAVLAEMEINWRSFAWLRLVPHMNDTVLLIAAMTLATMSGQAPWAVMWLAAKLGALVVYIDLGRRALKAGASQKSRRIFTVLAFLTVAYIVCVAITRSASLNICTAGVQS